MVKQNLGSQGDFGIAWQCTLLKEEFVMMKTSWRYYTIKVHSNARVVVLFCAYKLQSYTSIAYCESWISRTPMLAGRM